jgi:hypothetical protein
MKEKCLISFVIVFSFVIAEICCGGITFEESSSSVPPPSGSRSPSPSCSNECQQNFEQDPETCECRCTKSSECEQGYYWLEDACSCLLVCDYVMECPADQKWDFIKCGCVDEQPSD